MGAGEVDPQLTAAGAEVGAAWYWAGIELLLQQLETLGRHESWVAPSIAFTRQLMRERAEQRMSKEMLYKSSKMQIRLSSTDEEIYSSEADFDAPVFLPRKSTEGPKNER